MLKEHDAATAQAIYDLLKEELLSSQLDIKDVMGLATDGASVMVGSREGVASKLNKIIHAPLLYTVYATG